MEKPIKPILLKPVQGAKMINCSTSKFYDLLARGEIPSVRVGGMLRVPLAALEKIAAGDDVR